jgi:hypothetical protein
MTDPGDVTATVTASELVETGLGAALWRGQCHAWSR